jgi:hypothetical protein
VTTIIPKAQMLYLDHIDDHNISGSSVKCKWKYSF